MILNAFTRGVQKSFDTQLDIATRDPLTGLLNRRGLELWLEEWLRSTTNVAVAIFDLDRFKAINDAHGHSAGDDVLVRTAGRLQASLGNLGLLARTGGEEFTAVLRTHEVSLLAHAMHAAVHDNCDTIPATASVGVTILSSTGIEMADPIETLREGARRADIALYEAKRTGRKRVFFYRDMEARQPNPALGLDTEKFEQP